MNFPSLPRWLARLFTVLFYGQIALLLFVTVLIGLLLVEGPFANESGTFVFPIELNGRINSPVTKQAQALAEWSEAPQAFDLKLGLPAFLSKSNPNQTQTFWLNMAVRSWTDLAEIPRLLSVLVSGMGLLMVLLVWTTYQFKCLFQSIADERVFNPLQVQRLTRIGFGFIAYFFVGTLMNMLLSYDAVELLAARGYVLKPALNFTVGVGSANTLPWIVTGLCLLALAQVFRYGTQLQQESELTI
ncbi:DUF2975 domain-containing protein [Fibrella sp. WM1]|uniref:DUF2975 domain-containing protein n=1 Tax=Fibrella musci TaxID=3242485 RepID=UPI00352143E5